MKLIAEVHGDMNVTALRKTDPRTGQRLRNNKGVRKAYRQLKREEALVRQAFLISLGRTPNGGPPAPLEYF